jgi:membrane-associated phospholipid phosphatase
MLASRQKYGPRSVTLPAGFSPAAGHGAGAQGPHFTSWWLHYWPGLRAAPVFAFISLALNLLMIVSALSECGHYLVDLAGDLAVAVVTIRTAFRLAVFDSPAGRPL